MLSHVLNGISETFVLVTTKIVLQFDPALSSSNKISRSSAHFSGFAAISGLIVYSPVPHTRTVRMEDCAQ